MSVAKSKTILLFILYLSCYHCAGQSYLLSSFPAEKELSSRQITCFFQDSKGFIWIGTEDGLNLYNANSIKIFKHDVNTANSLQDNSVQNLCEDKLENIWIATGTGVDRFTPSTNHFIHFSKDDKGENFGFKPRVYIDRKGNTWIGSNGLFKFDPEQQQFKRITNPYSNKILGKHLANSINGFYNDSKNRYWISTYDGLFLYDDNSKIFERFDTPPTDDSYKKYGILFSSVYEDKNNELWVGTWGYGMFKISVAEKKLYPFGERDLALVYTSQKLNGRQILWCAINGLSGFSSGNTENRLKHSNDDPYSLRKNGVNALFTDNQDQLWIGYATQGIQVLNPGNQFIQTHTVSAPKGDGPSISMIAKKKNVIYAGGWYRDALYELTDDFKTVKKWKYLPPEIKRSSTNVSDIFFDKEDNLWVATFNGLVYISKKNGAIKVYKHDSSVTTNNRFLKFLPEGDSVLWIGGFKNGLSRFSLNTHTFQLYGNNTPIFWNIVYDNNGNIWCANNNGFIEKFDRRKKIFTTFIFDTLTERSLYYDIVFDSIYNALYISTSNGLLKVSLANLKARLFTEKDGLPTSRINLLTWDQQHRLWIGTEHGLSLYNQRRNSFRNFYMNNGLSTEKIDQLLSVEEDGKLYMAVDNSIMTMDIAEIDDRSEISPVYITGIFENGNLIQPKWKNKSRVIDLPYTQNNLSFEFAIADFINAEDNQLFYQLDGWDKDFIQTKKGIATYNKLLPGKYTFRVKGINHSGVLNATGDAITIIIHPPFWETWWFITISSVVLLTALVFAVRYISQRNLKEKLLKLEKEQAVEKERNRISKDMHDDLGSGLTKIAIMSEVVKKQFHEPEKAKQQLENISESSRELVDSLQDIIWVLNPKNDTLENLAAYIREYALKFFDPFAIQVLFHYPDTFPGIKLSEETRRNIFLTVKETLANIGKHAWCNKVNISVSYSNDQVKITIADDGKGFDINTTRQFGNGLINMQHRIEQIGGRYNISSVPGKGATTTIIISP